MFHILEILRYHTFWVGKKRKKRGYSCLLSKRGASYSLWPHIKVRDWPSKRESMNEACHWKGEQYHIWALLMDFEEEFRHHSFLHSLENLHTSWAQILHVNIPPRHNSISLNTSYQWLTYLTCFLTSGDNDIPPILCDVERCVWYVYVSNAWYCLTRRESGFI